MENKNIMNISIKKESDKDEEILDCTKEIEEYLKDVLPKK